MTRQERQQMKRRRQILKAKRAYRQRQREKKAQPPATGASTAPAPDGQQPLFDPVWGDDPVPAAPDVPSASAHAPLPPPEPEEPVVPKPEFRYVRRAARLKVPKEPQGPVRGGESPASWGQGRQPTDVPVDFDNDPWEN